jgi:lipid II:glycine glycyltransferase (peptidoglycan interpeptide bridge formation enzyme)
MGLINFKENFKKIAKAFDKVRTDIKRLEIYIANLERDKLDNKKKINKLEKEIEFLKQVVLILETENNKTDKIEIIGNKGSLMFHRSSCPYAKKVLAENKIIFSSIESAKKKGFKPCKCIEGEL